MSWSHDYWPRDKHEYLLELIKADNGGELPDWAIAADLVYHADLETHPTKPIPFPGRRRLEKRWGVSERITRRSLASQGWQEKCDRAGIPLPKREIDRRDGEDVDERPRSRTHGVPGTVPNASPVPSPPQTDEAEQLTESVPGTVPGSVPGPVPTASPVMSTRAYIGPTVPPVPGPNGPTGSENKLEPLAEARSSACEEPEGKEPKGKAKANAVRRADFVEAVRVWDEEVVPTARKAGATIGEHPRLDPSKALGKALRQRLDEQGLEAVLLVFRWYASSSNSRASFLREGGHELSTLTRAAKFEEYLGFARAEAASAAPKVGKAAHDAPEPTIYTVSDEERAKLRAAKAAARASIEADRLALEAKQQRLVARIGVPRD